MLWALLSELVVEDDIGRRVAVTGERQQRVLSALVATRGRRVSASSLIDEVWPEEPPNSATSSLQVAIGKLRQVIGPDRIDTLDAGYALVVRPGELVAEQFEQLVADSKSADQRGDQTAVVRLLHRALAMWPGQPADVARFGGIARAEMTRLRELRALATERLATCLLAEGRPDDAVDSLHFLAAEQPLRETTHEILASALYAAGRQVEALDAISGLQQRLADELGLDLSPVMAELQARVLVQDRTLPSFVRSDSRLIADATAEVSSLIGREAELLDIQRLMDAGARLVTLTGPGGIGKTRLLKEFGSTLLHGQHSTFVDLSGLIEPELLVPTLAVAVGVRERGERPLLDHLAETLGVRPMTMLLDNFEQLISQAGVLHTLLARCVGTRMIVTSRERLAIAGEFEYAIAPLDVPREDGDEFSKIPADPDQLRQSPAIQLFVARAEAVDARFAFDASNASTIAALVRRLDGLPLALELAAARVKLMTPAAILDRLNTQRSGAFATGGRDRPARHKTLEATIAWSYDSLTEEERLLLQECAVFAGGVTLDALEAIAQTVGLRDPIELAASLLDKSLVVRVPDPEDLARISMLHTIRSYVVAQMLENGHLAAARRRQAEWAAALAEQLHDQLYQDMDATLARMDIEIDNIRGALDWALTEGWCELAVTICTDTADCWFRRGALAEGLRWMHSCQPLTEPGTFLHARLTSHTAHLEMSTGFTGVGVSSLAETVDFLRHCPPTADLITGLLALCEFDYEEHGEITDLGLRIATEARDRAEPLGLPQLMALSSLILGVTLAEAGRSAAALEHMRSAEIIVRDNPAAYLHAVLVTNLSWTEIQLARYESARDRLVAYIDTAPVTEPRAYLLMSTGINAGWALLGTKEYDQAVNRLLVAARLAIRRQDAYSEAEALLALGCCAAQMHSPQLANLAFRSADQRMQLGGLRPSPYASARRQDAEDLIDGLHRLSTSHGSDSVSHLTFLDTAGVLTLFAGASTKDPLRETPPDT